MGQYLLLLVLDDNPMVGGIVPQFRPETMVWLFQQAKQK